MKRSSIAQAGPGSPTPPKPLPRELRRILMDHARGRVQLTATQVRAVDILARHPPRSPPGDERMQLTHEQWLKLLD